MDIRSIILGFLSERDMTGYEVRKRFSLSFSFFSELSYGSVYPALKALEKDGFVSMQDEAEQGPRRRKVYRITESGREVFLSALAAPVAIQRQKSEFLMRLFFFSNLTPFQQKTLATTYVDSVRAVRDQLEAVRPDIEERANRWQYLCFQFGLRFYSDLAANAESVLEALETENVEARDGMALLRREKGARAIHNQPISQEVES